jgi:hypothetical protein
VNTDRLNNVPLSETAQSTFAIFSELQMPQHDSNEQRVAALACATLLAARRFGVNPNKLWELANNLIHGADGTQVPEFAGAARYLREEF